jgi:hypothetical protein
MNPARPAEQKAIAVVILSSAASPLAASADSLFRLFPRGHTDSCLTGNPM